MTRDKYIESIYTCNLQNTNGRESEDEMFMKGVEACFDTLHEDYVADLLVRIETLENQEITPPNKRNKGKLEEAIRIKEFLENQLK